MVDGVSMSRSLFGVFLFFFNHHLLANILSSKDEKVKFDSQSMRDSAKPCLHARNKIRTPSVFLFL